MARIENYRYTVEEAFRENFYIIPDYQREYVWTDKEVQQLLDDVNEQMDVDNKEYFVGTILVSPSQERGHHEVIDGQQRLTTFFLILCVLKHFFQGEESRQTILSLMSASHTDSDGNTHTSLKLDPRYESASDVMKKIVEISSDPDAVRNGIQAADLTAFGSLENLINAYGTIYRYLNDNYVEKGLLKKFWGHLANNVIFIQISADISSALKIFETINERGVGLNPMDLLKNLLFTRVQPAEFTKLKTEWKKVTKPLEKKKEKPLRFLRYFLMANYTVRNSRKDYIIREDEIYDWLTNDSNAALCGYREEPFEFVRKIIKNVENYLAYAQGLGNDHAPSVAMDNLKKLCGGAFSLHFILLLAASPLPKPLFDHFVRQLESYLFYFIFTRTATKELERNFSIWADELRNIASLTNEEEQVSQLNQFIQDRFENGMQSKESELNDALKRYNLYSMQKYRTRYLLGKIAQHVDMAYKGVSNELSLQDYLKLEVEHILPDSPKDEYRKAFEATSDGKEYDHCKVLLGNLTLLEKPINIVASNNFYEKKQPEYQKCSTYLTRSIVELTEVGKNSSINRINEKLKAFPEWNAQSIQDRQDVLIALTKDIWRVSEV